MSSTGYRASTGDISSRARSRSGSRSRSRDGVDRRGNTNRSGGWERHHDQHASEREARSWEAEEYKRNLAREASRREGPRRSDFSSDPVRPARRLSTHKNESAESNRNAAQVELTGILGAFVAKISQQCSLQMQKEHAKTNLEHMKSHFEKGVSYHTDYPSAAEAQMVRINRAQKDLDDIKTNIVRNDAELHGTLQSFAALCLPNKNEIEIKYLELKQDYEKLEQKVAACERLDSQFERRLIDFGASKRQQDEAQVTITRSFQNTIQLLQNNFQALQEKVDAPLNTHLDVKSRLESLSSRVDEFPRLRIDVSKTSQEVKEHLKATTEKSKMIDEMKNSEAERNEEIKTLKDLFNRIMARDEKFDAAIKRTVANVSGIDDDLSNLQARVVAIENRDLAGTALNPGIVTSDDLSNLQARVIVIENRELAGTALNPGIVTSDAFEDLKVEIEALRKGQDATDEACGQVIQNLQDRCVVLESMKDRFDTENQRISSRISENEQKFSQQIEHQQRETHDLRESQRVMTMQRDNTPSSVGFSALIDSKLDNLKRDVDKRFKEVDNGQESASMAITHLDTRMNNLTTDQLARQMIGQLQTIYPNVSNVETTLVSITNSINMQKGQLRTIDTTLASLVNSTEMQKDQFRAMDGKVLSLTKTIERLGYEGATADISALKEKSDLLRSNFNTIAQQIEELSTVVKNLQDDYISKDEVNEKTNTLNMSIGALQHDVGELSERRNAHPATQNGGSRSQTPAAAIEQSHTEKKKRKRKQSIVSPSKVTNGHKKPRKTLLGGFQVVDSDEEDEFRPATAPSDGFSSS